MKKLSFALLLIVCFCTLKSDIRITDRSETTDVSIADSDFNYDYESEDFGEEAIRAFDNIQQVDGEIEICPGTGVKCYIIIWDGNNPTVYLGKKTVNGPDILIRL